VERPLSENSPNTLADRWHQAADTVKALPGATHLFTAIRIFRAALRDILRGDLQVRAASLVYSTLLALVPLIAVSFSVLKGFGVQNQMRGFIGNLFPSVGDDKEAIVDQIITFVNNMEVGVLGGVGLVFLFYTVFSLIRKIEMAVNFCWRTYESRSVADGFTRYISILIFGPVLLFGAMTMSASITSEPLYQKVASIPGLASIIDWGGQLLPYGILVLVFSALYYFLPNTWVRIRAALAGGLIAGFLWFLFSMGFARFVAGSGNYVAIYATFATMVIFMLWLFLAWLVLLFGASIAFYAQNPGFANLSLDHENAEISGQARERIAFEVMAHIGNCYIDGRTPPSLIELSEQLNMPIQSVSWVITIMEKSRLVMPTTASPPRYVPGRAPSSIFLRDIVTAVRTAGHEAIRATDLARQKDPAVKDLVSSLDSARQNALGDSTLQDLIENKQPE